MNKIRANNSWRYCTTESFVEGKYSGINRGERETDREVSESSEGFLVEVKKKELSCGESTE